LNEIDDLEDVPDDGYQRMDEPQPEDAEMVMDKDEDKSKTIVGPESHFDVKVTISNPANNN